MLTEVEEFRRWAAKENPSGDRKGEWECDYPGWDRLYAAVVEFLGSKPFSSWSTAETGGVLYAIARDNEHEYIGRVIREHHGELLASLAWAAVERGERNNRWQLANQLGRTERPQGHEEVLLVLVRDEDEYVRRRALGALARIGSPCVQSEAVRAWERPGDDQQWSRMMALWCLHRVGSPMLEQLLAIAEQDPREHLRGYAERMRRGEVEP
jgi:hypothetical protein